MIIPAWSTGNQWDVTELFPADPFPPLDKLGDLPTQFTAIDAFLSLPAELRQKDIDLAWSIVCGVIEHQKGGQR